MSEDSTNPPVHTQSGAQSPLTGEAGSAFMPAQTVGAPTTPPKQPNKVFGLIGVILLAVVLYIIPAMLVGIIMAMFLGFLGNGLSEDLFASTGTQFVYIALVEPLTIAMTYGFMRVSHLSWRDIGWKKPTRSPVWPFIKAFGVYFLLLIMIGIVLQYTSIDTDQPQEIGFENAQGAGQLALVFLSLVVLPPLAEEIIFRGFLYTRLKRYFSVGAAAVLISVMFGFAHLQLDTGNTPLWTAAIDTFVLSLLLVYLREKTGSLWPSIAMHALKNLIAFSTLFLFK